MSLSRYLKEIKERHSSGISSEHSYRGTFEQLFKELVSARNIAITGEPSRVTDCGMPDFVVTRDGLPVGFIETKDVGRDLDSRQYREQFDRYRESLDNLIITDYLLFRFYRYGELVKEIRVGEISSGKVKGIPANYQELIDWLQDFVSYEAQAIETPQKLAEFMARKARLLESIIYNAVSSDEENKGDSDLREQYQAFKEVLIHDLTPNEFADVYAQTIAYGMFAARLHDPDLSKFTREDAAKLIPKTNPFLRNLFQYIAGYDIDERMETIVNTLAEVFRSVDVRKFMQGFGESTGQTDPVIHFYETFLAEYDPKQRKGRGVFYTPEPVVNFIVRAVDDILQDEFGLSQGLADTSKTTAKIQRQGQHKAAKEEIHKVQILDPAAGTGTFLSEVVKLIYEKKKNVQGIWSSYVENELIPRLHGFELLIAPYTMAHLKLELLLNETGFQPEKNRRLRVFLTNALEEPHPYTGSLLASWLSNEATEANFVKRDTPVMVVLGNPPYSVSSANRGEWIQELITEYKKGLNEKKLNIDDDYIKFIRYGQYFIENNGEGILAFISNNSFLYGITHRQMRKCLLESFDKIYILNLHGNVKRKEVASDGTKDENIFDIQQGVSINIFIKNYKGKNKKKNKLAIAYYQDIFGSREKKYELLLDNFIDSINWNKLNYSEPYYFLIPKNFELEKEYENYFEINNLLTVSNSAIKTDRDSLFIDHDKNELEEKMKTLFSGRYDNDFKQKYRVFDSGSYKLSQKIKEKSYNPVSIRPTLYKPFDYRWIYYDPEIISRPGRKVFDSLVGKYNLGLCLMRTQVNTTIFSTVFITNSCIDLNFFGFQTYVFPLYLYPKESGIFEKEKISRKPNLNPNIVQQIAENLELQFTPEKEDTEDTFAPIDLLDYIYAVLHSPTYREKYKEFLKIDFPRVPYPQDPDTFWNLVELGGKLRELHLMESPYLDNYFTTYPQPGSNKVEQVKYDRENKQVWINKEQYFGNVPEVAWEFYIGGYQPAQKWLKDRKGRVLENDDIEHYCKIIVVLVETDRLMKEIDNVKDEW